MNNTLFPTLEDFVFSIKQNIFIAGWPPTEYNKKNDAFFLCLSKFSNLTFELTEKTNKHKNSNKIITFEFFFFSDILFFFQNIQITYESEKKGNKCIFPYFEDI